jgi:dCMP deaminase
MGYNGAPAGLPHCHHSEGATDPCTKSTHAEANAIAFAAKNGIRIRHASMFTTHSPCIPCTHLIINAGLVAVYYVHEFRDASGIDLLKSAGLQTFQFPSTPEMYQG